MMAKSQQEIISVGGISIRKGEKIRVGCYETIFSGEIVSSKKKIAIQQQLELTEQEIIILDNLKGRKFDHIIEVLTYEQNQNGIIYILMEFGKELNIEKIENKEETFLQMAKGVYQFHQLGFFHRDLKPQNFIIGEDGRLKLTGFNIAKNIYEKLHTMDIGTIRYMAPEVHTTDDYDSSIDIWSLGIIFFEILTGETFFEVSSYYEIYKQSIEISQLQINNKIKQQNLELWQEEILQKMIVQRLNNKTYIKRIGIDALVEELAKLNVLKKKFINDRLL